MAVEICTESSSIPISPRISFSHDLNQSDIVPIEPHIPFKFDYDFDFCVNRKSYDQESSIADEIFVNGVIIPIPMKKKNQPMRSKSSFSPSLLPPLPPSSVSTENVKETAEKLSKSFWKFKRSKSFNCGSICRRSFCSFTLLPRSKSTGSSSSSSSKRSFISKDDMNQDNNNNGGLKHSCEKRLYSSYYQKPPLKKNYASSLTFVHVSPVLNVSTGNFLGLGSIFSNANDKGKKK